MEQGTKRRNMEVSIDFLVKKTYTNLKMAD